MKFLKKYFREMVFATLLASNIAVWSVVYRNNSSEILTVYFLDVGQGDAILIDSPEHKRVLIDGGKNRGVLTKFGEVMPFGDRNIDVVIETHPDADHIGGLPEVISRYNVGMFLKPGVESDNTIDNELEKRVNEKNIPEMLARRGMVINFGDGVRLEILFPNQDVSNWETNRASVVARLVYKDKSFLFTGDSPTQIENVLVNLDGEILDVDVLKAGHHGSRTSSSKNFVEKASPEYAVISAGEDNSYGHPHKEVIEIFKNAGAEILNTSEGGTIKFETDGENLLVK